MPKKSLTQLKEEITQCTACASSLALPPKPVVQLDEKASILIVAQAPGTKARASGRPFDDASGDRLRSWLGIDRTIFYDETKIACMPMGFCYPGKTAQGDLPPCKDCAPLWHPRVMPYLNNIKLTIYVGRYAQKHYLGTSDVTTSVKKWQDDFPHSLALPHPSWHNTAWLRKNPWFIEQVVPALQKRVQEILKK